MPDYTTANGHTFTMSVNSAIGRTRSLGIRFESSSNFTLLNTPIDLRFIQLPEIITNNTELPDVISEKNVPFETITPFRERPLRILSLLDSAVLINTVRAFTVPYQPVSNRAITVYMTMFVEFKAFLTDRILGIALNTNARHIDAALREHARIVLEELRPVSQFPEELPNFIMASPEIPNSIKSFQKVDNNKLQICVNEPLYPGSNYTDIVSVYAVNEDNTVGMRLASLDLHGEPSLCITWEYSQLLPDKLFIQRITRRKGRFTTKSGFFELDLTTSTIIKYPDNLDNKSSVSIDSDTEFFMYDEIQAITPEIFEGKCSN